MNPYERLTVTAHDRYACGMGEVMKARSRIVPPGKGEVAGNMGMAPGLNLAVLPPRSRDLNR